MAGNVCYNFGEYNSQNIIWHKIFWLFYNENKLNLLIYLSFTTFDLRYNIAVAELVYILVRLVMWVELSCSVDDSPIGVPLQPK